MSVSLVVFCLHHFDLPLIWLIAISRLSARPSHPSFILLAWTQQTKMTFILSKVSKWRIYRHWAGGIRFMATSAMWFDKRKGIMESRHRISILFNTLRPRQNGRHFAEDIFKCIFLNENVWIPIRISLKFVPKCLINNNPALVQIKAWRRPGDKPLSEPLMVSLPTHICVTRLQWVNKCIMM